MIDWLVNKDFANYWIAARLVLDGQTADLFGPHAGYFRHMTEAFGPDYPWHNWSYPPHFLLLIWPLGFMGYPFAMAVFLGVTLALYALALRSLLPAGTAEKAWSSGAGMGAGAAAVLLLPFLFSNIQHAQNGFLTGALFVAGLALRDRRPWLAGVMFGLLTIKPQLGVLLPFLLLIERNGKVILSTLLTAAALVLLSVLCFGLSSWQGYIETVLPYQSRVMTEGRGGFLAMMPSVFGSLRALGMDSAVALPLHLAFALPVFGLSLYGIWRSQSSAQRAVIAILATMLVTPYWLVYDYGAAAAALALFLTLSDAPADRRARLFGWLMLAAMVPLAAIPLGLAGLPLSPLLILPAFLLALRSPLPQR